MEPSNNHPHVDLAHLRSPIEPAHRGRAQRLVEAAERIGVVRLLRGIHDRGPPALIVLAYHRVMPTDALELYPFDQELISATPAQFDWQMRYLRENLHPVAIRQVIEYLDGAASLPPGAVAVTFDDGFADTFRYAFPILKRHSIPATIFLATGYVDSREPFWFELAAYLVYHVEPNALILPDGRTLPPDDSKQTRTNSLRQIHGLLKDLPNAQRVAIIREWTEKFHDDIAHDAFGHSQPISWQQVSDMAAAGIDFGSHTVSHPNLTRLTEAELDWELTESKRVLEERLQREVNSLAYPIGTSSAFDDRVIAATKRCGFKLGVTYLSGANPLSAIKRFELHRHGIGLGMTLPYFRALTSLPSWLD